jgi:pimeloyl-ACP methyl ester carboxylesterase
MVSKLLQRVQSRRRAPPAPEAGDDPSTALGLTPPGLWLLMLEARAPWEAMGLMAVSPWLSKLPTGDGHPVLVLPGLGASDFSTRALRRFLDQQGYSAQPWEQGVNLGPRSGVLDGCRERIRKTSAQHGGAPVSLIGWSLGGIYAREMAKEMPDQVRCVITLGTPFTGHPKATNAWRFYQMVSGQRSQDDDLLAEVRKPPPVPTTSIYSKTDGIVAWPCSINPARHAHTENIEVRASHLGMGMNPLAMYAIADRLRQDPAHWKRFDAQGARRWFFKVAHQPEVATALY